MCTPEQTAEKEGIIIVRLNNKDINNRLHRLLPGIFPCITYDAYYIIYIAVKQLNKFVCLKSKHTTTLTF